MTTPPLHPPVFVLTVDPENGYRRQNCREQFQKVNMSFEFVQGASSQDPILEKLYSKWRNLLWLKRSLSEGEIAVYHGHRKAWQMFLDTGADVALVGEDDLGIVDPITFVKVMTAANGQRAWDVLKLFDFRPKRVIASESWSGFTIVDFKYPASGCVAYLITRDAAQRLLARSKIFRPVDEDFSYCWEFGLRIRSLNPNIVDEISRDLGGSTLEVDRRETKRKRNRLRSVWGVFLQVSKQIKARRYHHNSQKNGAN